MWEIEKYFSLLDGHSSDPCVIHYETEQNFKTLTWSEIFNFYKNFVEILTKHIPKKWQIIGLLMDFNEYIPSLVMSFLDNYSFIFLDPNTIDQNHNRNIINEIGVQWIITCETSIKSLKTEYKFIKNLTEGLDLYSINVKQIYSFEDIAYVVLTSGTTGKSKVVRVQNSCIYSNISSLRKFFNLNYKDVVYFGTPLTFDPSIVELLLSLTIPCSLLSVNSKIKLNCQLLYRILFTKSIKVSFLQIVPSLFLRWGDKIIEEILTNSSLKTLAFGGERFPESLFKLKISNDINIFNLYGITEVSCWASICKFSKNKQISLGLPLEDTLLEVRDGNGFIITEGEGELFVGSNSRICLIGEESSDISRPVFRASGDIVKISNSSISYKSRNNNVIKRFGHKVNLDEIENIFHKETGLNSAIVWCEKDQKLILFVLLTMAFQETRGKIIDNMKRKLMHLLPKAMNPDVIEIISVFPLTKNGKINKTALLEYYDNYFKNSITNFNTCDIFRKLLIKSLGLDLENWEIFKTSNFFDLGGTSFLFLQFINEFKAITGVTITQQLNEIILNSSLYESLSYIKNNLSQNIKRKIDKIDNSDEEENKFKYIKKDSTVELKINWSYNLRGCIYTSPVVIIHDEKPVVLCVSFYHVFAAIDCETGEMLSETILPDAVQGGICAEKFGKVFIGCLDGYLYCFDVPNFRKNWSFKTDGIVKSKPCLCRNQTAIIFGSYDGFVYCLSAEDGSLLWKNNFNSSISISPVYCVELKTVYLASQNKLCFCLSEIDGKLNWKFSVDSPLLGSPCLVTCNTENSILWPEVEGVVHCTKSSTGEKLWSFKAENQIYSSVISYENYFLFGCKDGNVYCVMIGENYYSLHYKIQLSSEITPTPCVFKCEARTYIFAATNNGFVYLIDFQEKKILVKIQMKDEIFCSPIYYNNKILFGCNDDNLYCFSIKN